MTDYADVADVKAAVGRSATAQDDNIARVITAVSQAIDRFCNRPDGFVAPSAATVRVFAGSGGDVQYIDEAAAISAVAVKASATDTSYSTWEVSGWLAFSGDPLQPDFNHTPFTALMAAPGSSLVFTSGWASDEPSWTGRGRGLSGLRSRRSAPPTVQVTAHWGYALEVPAPIQEACIIESARLVKQGEGNYADSLLSDDFGKQLMVAKLHPATQWMLRDGRFVRPTVG